VARSIQSSAQGEKADRERPKMVVEVLWNEGATIMETLSAM
jgi:hypothetical protein